MITDIIFDFFGTLVDYSESREIAGNISSYEYLKTMGINIPLPDFINSFDKCFLELENKAVKEKTEFHMYELGKLFFKTAFNIDIDDNSNEIFTQKYIDDWNCKTVYYNGIREFIKDISQKYRISILSNTHFPKMIHDNLINMKIRDCFYKIYTSVEIHTRKPNKEIFEFVLKDLNIPSNNSIFIGDNYKDDYMGAKTVNMKCYLIDKHNRHNELNEYKINNLFELKDRLFSI